MIAKKANDINTNITMLFTSKTRITSKIIGAKMPQVTINSAPLTLEKREIYPLSAPQLWQILDFFSIAERQ